MALTNSIYKGDDLMLFKGGRSIAFATSHTLTVTADAASISSKDNGIWAANAINKISWEISSENLFTAAGYDDLFNAMLLKQPIDVYFGAKQDLGDGVCVADNETNPYWTPAPGYDGYQGQVLVTSLTLNANTGENATYSVTLTGTGQLKHQTYQTPQA